MLPRTRDALKALTDAHVGYLTQACKEGTPTDAMHLSIAVYSLASETEELAKALGRVYMAINDLNATKKERSDVTP